MTISFEDFTEDYQYPVLGFQKSRVVWANACARMILGQRINDLTAFFSDGDISALLEAYDSGNGWRGEAAVGEAAAIAELVVYGGKGYITIRPGEYKKGRLMDQMLSDMGQLMKDPLNNLYGAIQDLDDPRKLERAAAVIRHSFYNLVRLSENQIAVSASHGDIRLAPVSIVDFVQDAIAAVNETLGDRDITVELSGDINAGRLCNVHPQKLTHLLMLLISNAARGLKKGMTVTAELRFDDNNCYIGIPVSGGMISLYDSTSYLTAAGTPKSLESLENMMLAKIIKNFNDIHGSRVFASAAKGGGNMAVIALATMSGGVAEETRPVSPGLRLDLIFLSDILDKDSYV
ncbi:MAG: hypothetical protein FWH16_04960 [Oscillospiraceae bacterium]|nr:hypothetical protein [Oscillospiraceae bacterium]